MLLFIINTILHELQKHSSSQYSKKKWLNIKSETTITIKQKPETVIVLKQKLLSFVMTPSVVQ